MELETYKPALAAPAVNHATLRNTANTAPSPRVVPVSSQQSAVTPPGGKKGIIIRVFSTTLPPLQPASNYWSIERSHGILEGNNHLKYKKVFITCSELFKHFTNFGTFSSFIKVYTLDQRLNQWTILKLGNWKDFIQTN